uniref:Uncharacterized protein n=1 Tax=Romanomermis culicivorax TaxID=13658 RepID=A0A915IRD4_ROMCU
MLCYVTESETILNLLFRTVPSAATLGVTAHDTKYKILNFTIKQIHFDQSMEKFITKREYNVYMGIWLKHQTNFFLTSDRDFYKNYTSFSLPVNLYPNGHDLRGVVKLLPGEIDVYRVTMAASAHDKLVSHGSACHTDRIAMASDKICFFKCGILYPEKDSLFIEFHRAFLIEQDYPWNLCSYRFIFLSEVVALLKLKAPKYAATPFIDKADNIQPAQEFDRFVTISSTNAGDRMIMRTKCEENCSKYRICFFLT